MSIDSLKHLLKDLLVNSIVFKIVYLDDDTVIGHLDIVLSLNLNYFRNEGMGLDCTANPIYLPNTNYINIRPGTLINDTVYLFFQGGQLN